MNILIITKKIYLLLVRPCHGSYFVRHINIGSFVHMDQQSPTCTPLSIIDNDNVDKVPMHHPTIPPPTKYDYM